MKIPRFLRLAVERDGAVPILANGTMLAAFLMFAYVGIVAALLLILLFFASYGWLVRVMSKGVQKHTDPDRF